MQQSVLKLSCLDFFSTVSSTPQLLQKGYQLVYKYLSNSQCNREQTLIYLLNDKVPILTLVIRTYPIVYCDVEVGIQQNEKQKTREYLVMNLLKQIIQQGNRAKVENFIRFIVNFHNQEGYQYWVNIYQRLLDHLVQINSQIIGYLLIQILKNSDSRVSCFSQHILSFVITNATKLKISQQQSLQIIYYCIKSMAFMNGTDDQTLQKYVQPFQDKIIQYIQTSMSKTIKIMKFSFKILTVFAADYEIVFQKSLIQKLKQNSKSLVIEFISLLNNRNELDQQQQNDQNSSSISCIIYQLIQLISTLLSNEQLKISDFQLLFTVSLPSLLLPHHSYLQYQHSSDIYLSDIQDQSERSLRNKSISFLLQIVEGEYPAKPKGRMQQQLLKYSLLIFNVQKGQQHFITSICQFFNSYGLKLNLHNYHTSLFVQSLAFLLYNLTEEILTFDIKTLQTNKRNILQSIGKQVTSLTNQSLQSNSLIIVAYINLLNKLIRAMSFQYKQKYYYFLTGIMSRIRNNSNEKGILLSCIRGIAYVSNDVTLVIGQSGSVNHISIGTIQMITEILVDNNNIQQSAHLVLQFYVLLLKKCITSKPIIQNILTPQIQMTILTNFIHDGTIVQTLIDLLGEIGHQEFVSFVFAEFSKGLTKEQNISLLISKWINKRLILLHQNDLISMLKVYSGAFVAKIVKQYLSFVKQRSLAVSGQLSQMLNKNLVSEWMLPMLQGKILANAEKIFIQTIQKIAYILTSQYQIENILLLPYFTFLNNPTISIQLITNKSSSLYYDFVNKLIRYAPLFQGSGLKMVTAIVLMNIAIVGQIKIEEVLTIIQQYGSVQTDQWEDQHDQQSAIDRMFNTKIVNDQLETQFHQVFSNIIINTENFNQLLNQVKTLKK